MTKAEVKNLETVQFQSGKVRRAKASTEDAESRAVGARADLDVVHDAAPNVRPGRRRPSSRKLYSCLFSRPISDKMATVLPKDVSKLGQEVKLFGKWETQECVFVLLGIAERELLLTRDY